MPDGTRFGFVVEYVKDIEEARRFYEGVLGLRVEREHPTFVQFEHFALASDEPMAGKGEPEVYWLVGNAKRAFDEISRAAEVVLPLQQKPFGQVFGVRDPDGQPRYLLELAANRPSRPAE
jgi:catechol 2,3-dioxygenase-like lactoylglutathione lyase family enzyme